MRVSLFSWALLLCWDGTAALGQTIVDTAVRNNGKARVVVEINSPVGTLDRLVFESSLIVRGVVRSAVARLSNDKRSVVTDYEITPRHLYKGAQTGFNKPGEVQRIIVQRTGGTLVLDGLELSTEVNEWPTEAGFAVDDEVIVFLARREDEPGNYYVVRNEFGAFRVFDGKVAALTATASLRRGDEPQSLEAFENQLASRIAK
jgi:hypothetical protein